MGVTIGDPLTQTIQELRSYTSWPRTREGKCVECGAPAMAHHRESCYATPIFAMWCASMPLKSVINSIVSDCVMYHSLIRCAECGEKKLSKDLLVIYQAPLNYPAAPHLQPGYKYPKNILKAVCPRHNRESVTAEMPSNGYTC